MVVDFKGRHVTQFSAQTTTLTHEISDFPSENPYEVVPRLPGRGNSSSWQGQDRRGRVSRLLCWLGELNRAPACLILIPRAETVSLSVMYSSLLQM